MREAPFCRNSLVANNKGSLRNQTGAARVRMIGIDGPQDLPLPKDDSVE